ncbi:MAG: cupin domain-containing protein [Clostridiales bacterium]|nr:cupin domain-containing protein [Clostridiales bacterium]
MQIGNRIRRLRLQRGLTQEELADRCELSKGFISLMERDLTSPSIATLIDILQSLGTDLKTFFGDSGDEKLVFGEKDIFVKEDPEVMKGFVKWLVPPAQKNRMEPILIELGPGGETDEDDPHEGEEFGYVLSGSVRIVIGDRVERARKDESFCFKPAAPHKLVNNARTPSRVLWISTPPSF